MIKVVGCILTEHDLGLVGLSALICVLGCFTTTTLMARGVGPGRAGGVRWLLLAALVFGCSVWSLHFVAMLAFMPGLPITYELGLTALSIVVPAGGAVAALLAWHAPLPRPVRVGLGGLLLGLAVTGMHYVGVAAMHVAGSLRFDPELLAASVLVSIGFSIVALSRAGTLASTARRLEVATWLSLAICGLHFTGMASLTVVPGPQSGGAGSVLGTTTLALVVGCVSLVVLVAGLSATLVERHLSTRALQDLGRMRLMSNLAQEVLLIHTDGVVLEVNAAGERLYKASAAEIIGRPVESLFTRDSAPALARRGRCPPALRHPEELEFRAVDGTHVMVELSCQPIEYLGRQATVVALRDLTDRRRDEARIRHLARHDALTGLANRYTLLERLDIALEAAAQSRQGLAVVYIDLDRFKPINDLHGHAAGDAVLAQVAKRILGEIQPTDTLARIGGDEFLLLLTSESKPDRVSNIATRVVEALRRPFQVEGHRLEVGASLGIALFPQDGPNADSLMRAADAAMYRVKEDGRGAVRFYEASMNAHLQARLLMQQELTVAIERDELVLHYQPIVNGKTGEVETFEALIRWNHPRRGMVPPIEFIPFAEQTGLIGPIGRWVIETACREAAAWPVPWRVSVNVSPVQFHHSDVCAVIAACLAEHGLPPARVVVEVTEGILIDDPARAVATLSRLRDLGVRIALDDFGTGYSSLSYLQLFKFDKFKIDKSFVKKLGQSEDALTITRTIVNLGHNLGLQVTAEGVETVAQLEVLRSLGCDQIQGYLVARPGPLCLFGEDEMRRSMALFGQVSATKAPIRVASADERSRRVVETVPAN